MRLHRIIAVIERHGYEARHSIDRVTDTVLWPVIDVILWGFMTVYLAGRGTPHVDAVAFLLGGAILWGLFRNVQRDIAIGFLGEVWARNLVGLFSTPLTIDEYFTGLIAITLVKAAAGLVVAGLAAWLFYAYDIFPQLPLFVPYIAILLGFALAVGMLVTGLIFRYTTRVQSLTWTITGLLVPFSCVFYPLAALPAVLRPFALALPTTQAFEGMRAIIASRTLSSDRLVAGFGLDLIYLAVAIAAFRSLFVSALARGLLVKLG